MVSPSNDVGMDKNNYKRLGYYIEPCLEKNKGLKVTLSQGISNEKYFQTPRQVALDSENDQIVRKGQFAYNKATTRNGEKISIAYRDGEDCTVSSAYQVFRITDENLLNPYYLMMWFKRPEFDRYARFKSFGSAHEFFTWEEMCDVMLPIPDIDEQRRIVAEYQTIEKRIENNNRLIQKLEATAQAIYRHTFVEGIDPENLPEGWTKVSALTAFPDITIGRTPPRENIEYFNDENIGTKWVSIADMRNANPFVLQTKECLTDDAICTCHVPVVPKYTILLSFKLTVGRVAITTEDICTNEAIAHFRCKSIEDLIYPYFYLKSFDYKTLGNTSSISDAINSKIIKQMPYIVPDRVLVEYFNQRVLPIIKMELSINKETQILSNLLKLICSKLS